MPKTQSPPGKKTQIKAKSVKKHKKISMDKVTIKRVKRNKKETSAKAKILAGIGVGSTLLGGVGAVSPQQESKEFVRENTSTNAKSKTSVIKDALSKVFGIGTAKASSVAEIQQEVNSAQAALDSFDSWYSGAMADVSAFDESEQQQRRDDINSARDNERQALVDALNEARARLSAAQANGETNLSTNQINNLLNPLDSSTQNIGVPILQTIDQNNSVSVFGDQETGPKEGDTRQGYDGTETYKDGQWILNAGISVQNPNGYFYVSDGSGGWTLKDGQTKTEGGTVYVSANGQWEAQTVNEGATKTEGGFTYTFYQGRWILDNNQVKTENGINYTSLDGSWQLIDGQTKTENSFTYTSINHSWVLDDGQTKQENGQTYTSSGGQWILNSSDNGGGEGAGGIREQNNYTEGQSAGFIDGDTSRPAIWHNAGTRGAPDWQKVDASGNNVTNGDGFVYTADGRGGWTLRDGQTKQENGKNYISRGGTWVEEVAGVTVTSLTLEETHMTVRVGDVFTKPVATATYSDGTTSQIQGVGNLDTSRPGTYTINYTAGDKTISFTLTVAMNAYDPIYPRTVTNDINNSRTGTIVVNGNPITVSVISDGIGNYVFDTNGNEISAQLITQGIDINALATAFANATVSNPGSGGGRETNNYTQGQSAGFIDGDTSRPAIWHNTGTRGAPDWVQVDKAGNEVRNSDGFMYVADGKGDWVLKAGQHKTENGKNYTSNSLGQWVEDQAGSPVVTYPTTVTSDINNSRTGTIVINGQSMIVSVIPGGYVFDSNGNEITAELIAQGVSISDLFNAFNQARVTTDGQTVTAGSIAPLPTINSRPSVNLNSISSASNQAALASATSAANGAVEAWRAATRVSFNSWLSSQNSRTDLTNEQKAEAAIMIDDFINSITAPITASIASAQAARAAQLNLPGSSTTGAPTVTRTASGGFTITMGNLTFTGASFQDVERQLQAAYQSYLGYANGNVKIDLNTYNALAAALTSSASGTTVNPASGSLGAYYEQGNVRVYRNPDGTYRIEILTNEPVLNPQTGQRGYNLILTGTSTASLTTLINQALRNVSGDTTLLLQNAISSIGLFNTQERTGQLRFTFQTNPNLNNPNGTGTTAQNAFHFATKETADSVVAMLRAAGLTGVTVTSQPVGNLTQYYVSFEGTNYQGNAGLIANLIQTGGIDAAVNLIRTELAEGKGDFKTMYLGVGTGGVVGSTNNYKAAPVGAANIPVFNAGSSTNSVGVNTQTTTVNSSTQTLPTGFILPPGGFPAGTSLPNGLRVSDDGKTIIDSQGRVVGPNGTQTTQTGTVTTNTNVNTGVNNTATLGQISTSSLAVGTVGVAYSQKLESTLNNETWGILGTAGLPQGLTLNSQTGVISGTPTTAGAYNIVVVATSGNSSAIKVFTLVINQAVTTSTVTTSNPTGVTTNNTNPTNTTTTNSIVAQITSGSLPVATVGLSYNYQFESNLTNETWAVLGTAGLPQGLTLNSQTGVISGTPTMPGNYTFVVAATSGSTSVVKAFTLTVNSNATTNTNTGGGTQTNNSGNTGTTNSTNNLDNTAITALQAQIASLQAQISQLNNSGQSSQITALQNQVSNLTNLLNSYNNRAPIVTASVAGLQMANINNGLEPGYTPEGYANTNRPVGLAMPAGYKASGAQIADTGIPAGFYFGAPQSGGLQMQSGSQVQGATTSTTYVVKKGDTLWNIAKKYYGDGKQWRKIMEENSDKVKNPKTLKIGTVLVIPGVNK